MKCILSALLLFSIALNTTALGKTPEPTNTTTYKLHQKHQNNQDRQSKTNEKILSIIKAKKSNTEGDDDVALNDPEYKRRREVILKTAINPDNLRKNLNAAQTESYQKHCTERTCCYPVRWLFPCYWLRKIAGCCSNVKRSKYCWDVLNEVDLSL